MKEAKMLNILTSDLHLFMQEINLVGLSKWGNTQTGRRRETVQLL